MVSEVGVGLIGFGTIGTGVVKVLRENATVISERLGFSLRLIRVADLDTKRDRGVDLEGIRFDDDAEALIEDPDVSIVIELIGGYETAKRLILHAIDLRKHVVTASWINPLWSSLFIRIQKIGYRIAVDCVKRSGDGSCIHETGRDW